MSLVPSGSYGTASTALASGVLAVTTLTLFGYPQGAVSSRLSKADLAREKSKIAAARAKGFKKPQGISGSTERVANSCPNDVLHQVLFHQCGNPKPLKLAQSTVSPDWKPISDMKPSGSDLKLLGMKAAKQLVRPYSKGHINLANVFDIQKAAGVKTLAEADVILCGDIHEDVNPWQEGCEQIVRVFQATELKRLGLSKENLKGSSRINSLVGAPKPNVVLIKEGRDNSVGDLVLQRTPRGSYMYMGMEESEADVRRAIHNQRQFFSRITASTEVTDELIDEQIQLSRQACSRDAHAIRLINREIAQGRKVVLSVGAYHLRPDFLSQINSRKIVTMLPKNYPTLTERQKAIYDITGNKLNHLIQAREWDRVLSVSDDLDRQVGPTALTDKFRGFVNDARGNYDAALSFYSKALNNNPYDSFFQSRVTQLNVHFLSKLLNGYGSSPNKPTDRKEILNLISTIRRVPNFRQNVQNIEGINAALRVVFKDQNIQL